MHKVTSIARPALILILLAAGNILFAHGAAPQMSQPTLPISAPLQGNNPSAASSTEPLVTQPFAPISDSTSANIQAPGQNPTQVTAPTTSPDAPVPQVNAATPLPPLLDYNQDIKLEQKRTKHIDQRMSSMLNSWIGVNVNVLIMRWGAPSNEYKMPNGNIIYTWHKERSIPVPLDITQVGNDYFGTGGGAAVVSCTISIFSDSHNDIINWKWEGNGC